jgi:hypothetical protein
MKKQLFWLVMLITLLASCKQLVNPEGKLPKETQEGKNTFGCILNGKVWTPSPNELGFNELNVSPEGNGWLTINANYRKDDRYEGMVFFSVNVFGTGDYVFDRVLDNRASFVDVKKNIEINSSDADVDASGVLTITKFDMNKHIVSGRFWFKISKKDGSATYEAKDGRFDISF